MCKSSETLYFYENIKQKEYFGQYGFKILRN